MISIGEKAIREVSKPAQIIVFIVKIKVVSSKYFILSVLYSSSFVKFMGSSLLNLSTILLLISSIKNEGRPLKLMVISNFIFIEQESFSISRFEKLRTLILM